MMKLSVITDEFTQELSEAIAFAREYGLDGLELRTIDDKPLEELTESRLHEIAEEIFSAGLTVPNLSSSFCKCFYDDREQENSKLEKLIQAARILKAPCIRGFGFYSENNPGREAVAKALTEPAKRLEQEGITLLLEADPSVLTTNHRSLRRLIDTINRPNVKAIYAPEMICGIR